MREKVSGIVLALLVVSAFMWAFNVQPAKASGTIYIRADGSIDPSSAPISSIDNITYTFGDSIYDSIIVERNNIVIDGMGYTLTSASGSGVSLQDRNNVTIKNMKIEVLPAQDGILLYESSNCSLIENDIKANWKGIELQYSSNNTLVANKVTFSYYAVWLEYSSNNTLIANNIGVNCNFGVYLTNSSNNIMSENTLTGSNAGVTLLLSSNNRIVGNDIVNNYGGIVLQWSSNNRIVENKVRSNRGNGVDLRKSSNNSVAGNDIAHNYHGIFLAEQPSNNSIHHNNFVNNAIQAYADNSINIWDDGYPSGGNFWSDYEKRYPGANEIDDSGIWNTPYVINSDNDDNYPLMELWSTPWNDWSHYHNYTEIVNSLLYLNETYPNLVSLFSIGKSWQNRDIYCVRLTNESNTHPKPKLFFLGYHHAREPISAELPLYFAVEAVTDFGKNATLTRLLNYSEIYIVPMLNVDAFDVFKQNEWQRKNVHPFDEDDDTLLDEDPPEDQNGDGYIADLIRWDGSQWVFVRWEGIDNDSDGMLNEDWVGGVDLNRNYGYEWNATCYSGSPYPWAEDYRGLAPFSEPETQAIRDLALAQGFKYAVSFHSGTEVIGYPWGYTTDPTLDDAIFREIAANLSELTGAPYGQSSGLYNMSGSWDDWMYANRSTFALTCEIYTNNSAWQYEPGPEPDTLWEKGVFQFFNPEPSNIETVVQRWLPVFTYTTNRAITEAYDVAVANVIPLKTVVGQGLSMNMTVTVTNHGSFTETLAVTAYANTTIIQTKTATVASGNTNTITFAWNTAGFAKGNYTLSAYAWPVEGETRTTDNRFTGNWVIIAMPGDITGSPSGYPDGVVDMKDISTVAKLFGVDYPDPRYKPNYDIIYDLTIDMKDISFAAKRFGQEDP